MPTYKPLGAKVQLVSYDLVESTSATIQRAKQSKVYTEEQHRTEQLCLAATPLSEAHLPCLGDQTRLQFLDDVPFYLVHARQTKARDGGSLHERVNAILEQRKNKQRKVSSSSKAPAATNDDQIPRALGIKITLPKEAFLRSFDSTAHESSGKRCCLKYDVFFNGELTVSDFQPSRSVEQQASTFEKGNIRIVTGKRVHALYERPWVIVPSGRDATGAAKAITSSVAAEDRWNAIATAVLQRADEQGYDEREERSPLGRYLANLSAMEMPDAVKELQSEGKHHFGAIDVVITVGKGNKGTGQLTLKKGDASYHYLSGPEKLVDPRYKEMPADWQPRYTSPPRSRERGLTFDSSVRRKTAAEQEMKQNLATTTTTMIDANTRGLASTAAFAREKRNIAAPASYRDKATRRSRTSQSPNKYSSPDRSPVRPPEPSPVRTPILPPFPTSLPVLDFADAIAITPTKAEEERRSRGVRDGSPSPSVSAGLRSKSAKDMPPPPLIPRSTAKRRHSDTISLASMPSSPVRSPSMTIRPGSPGSKSVSGYMGMTRRGVLSKKAVPFGAPLDSPGPAAQGSRSLPVVNRIIITDGISSVVDKRLSSPYQLLDRSPLPVDPHSVHQPLDESFFSSLKKPGQHSASPFINAPVLPPPIRPSVFEPNSSPPKATPSPARATPSPARSAFAPSSAEPSPSKPAPSTPKFSLNKGHSKATLSHEDIMAEERANWKLPELCEDCVITYSEERPWLEGAGAKGGLMRYVKSVRAGLFREEEVLFAVRFIVADV